MPGGIGVGPWAPGKFGEPQIRSHIHAEDGRQSAFNDLSNPAAGASLHLKLAAGVIHGKIGDGRYKWQVEAIRQQCPHLTAAFIERLFAAQNQVSLEFFHGPGHKIRFDPRIGLIEGVAIRRRLSVDIDLIQIVGTDGQAPADFVFGNHRP